MKTAEDILKEKGGKMVSVSEKTTIHDALKLMIAKKVGAVLVTDDGRTVGIWTSRDLMRNAVLEDFNLRTAVVRDYMTKPILSAPHTDTPYNLMDKFLGLRIRHLPVEEDGRVAGVVSIGDLVKAVIEDQRFQIEQLERYIAS